MTVGGGGGRSECTSSQAVDTSSLIDLMPCSSFDREIKGKRLLNNVIICKKRRAQLKW